MRRARDRRARRPRRARCTRRSARSARRVSLDDAARAGARSAARRASTRRRGRDGGGALARGRGVVVAASHTGNWDLAACAVARDVRAPRGDQAPARPVGSIAFWQSTRARRGRAARATPRGAIARARRGAARAGGAVAMMIDQVPASPRTRAPSSSSARPALRRSRPGGARRAARGAPLVVAAAARDAGRPTTCSHVLDVLRAPGAPVARLDRRRDARRDAGARPLRARPPEPVALAAPAVEAARPRPRRATLRAMSTRRPARHRRPELREPPDRRHRQVQGRRARPSARSTRRAPRSSPSRFAASTSNDRSSGSLMALLARKQLDAPARTPPAATPPTRPCARCASRASSGSPSMVKLEVIGDPKTLYPGQRADARGGARCS